MSHRSLSGRFLCLLTFSSVAALASAEEQIIRGDVLLMDRVHTAESSGILLPKRGMLMAQVESEFGAPSSRVAAVGGASRAQPPITRWVYPEFTVYFEHSHVVDAVINRAGPLEEGPKRP
ncbi:MAG: hypothetical protein BWZ07_01199 [Alphaproteobacteria bacterium ADurb.BinA280]|jgi:hypothetical protein|nr:hypothetical protein [Xanthomonadales bacterium]MCC6506944.1 hypothetical protein [Aquimonas sp.]OPZ12580.1 MAG: hypothetical protein BWZ07_01199 [Alphaproteobacteria bacterium ADurb.BinA280]